VSPYPSVPCILSGILSVVLSVLRASATHAARGARVGEPWQERRERNVPRNKPFPHVHPCHGIHAIVDVRLVETRLAVDLCGA
jgi:hypothetical protein